METAKEHTSVFDHITQRDLEAASPVGESTMIVHPISVRVDELLEVAHFLRSDPGQQYNFFSDIACCDWPEREQRFDLNYALYSIPRNRRLVIKVAVAEGEAVPSLSGIWPNASWHEREAYDLFGVPFSNHPDLTRILMPDNWRGHPQRKDYALGGEEVAFTHNWDDVDPQELFISLTEDEDDVGNIFASIDGDSPTIVPAPAGIGETKHMVLNMGPQHPSTHGVLRLVLELDGENIASTKPIIGYLHTGIEKNMEALTYQQALTLVDRTDYLCPLINNLNYCLAVEKLIGCPIPLRAQYIRVLLSELQRIASHLVWLGTHAMDIGASTVFLYAFREREQILDLFERMSGVRLMTSYINIGGLRDDLPADWLDQAEAFIKQLPDRIGEYETLLSDNPIWVDRTMNVGIISGEDAVSYGMSGASLRASGVNYDVRKAQPYTSYDHFEFSIPVGTQGDVYDRYQCRIAEMRESIKICNQVFRMLEPGPVQTDDLKVALPTKKRIDESMESLIHHFLIASAGFPVPAGEAYSAVESPRGELGCYVVSDGGPKPYRVKLRTPSFDNLQALPKMIQGSLVADTVAIIGSIDIVLGEIDR